MTQNRTRTVAMVAALLVISAVALPASVAAADGATLSVDVDQQPEDGDAVVTVIENDTTVENATVEVNASGNYSGTGTFATDANGSIVLPAPDETVDVTLTAKYNGSNVTETVTLVPLNQSLDVSVEQERGENATVTVTQYDNAVENASVNVSTEENVSYAGLGSYQTDTNGQTELPVPAENLTLTVTAASGDLTATTETDLVAAAAELAVSATQDDDGGVSIAVTEGDATIDEADVTIEGDYEYAGTYTAHNGTLSLPAPTENGTINVTATVDNETDNTALELVVPTDENPNNDFAESLVAFISFMKGDTDGPFGQAVSEFVHENNPASENAQGPPEHAGPDAADDEGDEDGDEGNETERRGPPDHAGSPADDDRDDDDDNETDVDADDLDTEDGDESDDDADEADEDDDENESDDDDGGPPEHAGPK